jgi:AraC-like DNA-binding protein
MSIKKIDLSDQGIRLYESKHTEGDVVNEHHHQVHQILYALEGEGKIFIDGESFDVSQDNCAVIVPFANHSIVSDSRLTVLVLAFDQTILASNVQECLLQHFFAQSEFLRMNPFEGSELRQLLRKMLFEQSQGRTLNFLAMNIYLSELLVVLSRSQKLSPITDANSLRAERIRNYIDSRYFEIVSSDDISARMGISARHVNNIFKERYNMTPIQYLTEVRMELAKKMLADTDKDIVSICFEIGFETVSTFYRTFKNSYKIPPNKYRQVHRIQQHQECI